MRKLVARAHDEVSNVNLGFSQEAGVLETSAPGSSTQTRPSRKADLADIRLRLPR